MKGNGKKILGLAMSVLMLLSVLCACASKQEAQTSVQKAQSAAPAVPDAAPAPAASASSTQSDAPAASSPVLDKIKASGKLVVGTEAQYPPYEFKDMNAEFTGCDMFLAQQIANALGVKLEIVDMAFDGIIAAVQSGQVDLGIAAFTNTPERAEVIDFSDLYETSQQLLIVKSGNAGVYGTKEALAGKQVGAQKGSIQSKLIASALPQSTLFELEKYPALALETQNGNIAGFVVDSAVGEALIATSGGALEVSDFAFSAEEASFGKSVVVAKGNEALVGAINQVIAKVTTDGSYQKAYDDAVALASSMGL